MELKATPDPEPFVRELWFWAVQYGSMGAGVFENTYMQAAFGNSKEEALAHPPTNVRRARLFSVKIDTRDLLEADYARP